MLATPGKGVLERRGWIYELKYDGFRCLAVKQATECTSCHAIAATWQTSFPKLCPSFKRTSYPLECGMKRVCYAGVLHRSAIVPRSDRMVKLEPANASSTSPAVNAEPPRRQYGPCDLLTQLARSVRRRAPDRTCAASCTSRASTRTAPGISSARVLP